MKKLTVLLLFFICATVTAQDALKKELFDVDLVMKYQSEIELAKEQKERIKKVHQLHISNFNSAKWDLDAAMTILNSQLEASSIKQEKALEQMKLINDLESQLKMIRLEMLIKVKNELSEVQQTKLKSLRTENDLKPTSVITPINDGQKIKLQIGKTVDSKDTPLFFVIDKNGKREVKRDYMNEISPDNIESVNVLKGKSAAKLYGKRGENGVIVIKMKNK